MRKPGRQFLLPGIASALALVVTGSLWINGLTSSGVNAVSGPVHLQDAGTGRAHFSAPGHSTQSGATDAAMTNPVAGNAIIGSWERVRVVRREGAFPYERVVERLKRDPQSGETVVLASRSMLADHVAITVPEGSDENAVREAITSLGYSVARSYPFSPVWQIALGRHDPEAVPEALDAIGSVLPETGVEPDILYFPSALPDDYDPVKMWGLRMIEAEAAWSIATGAPETVVGLIDSGAQLSHPDLNANLWVNPGEIAGNGVDDDGNGLVDDIHGWDFVGNDNSPEDEGRHGTHVAGTISAVGDNGTGVVGVNWSTRVIIVRVGDMTFTNSVLAQAIAYVTDLKQSGIDVVATNNSYGGSERSTQMLNAITEARDAGILFVAAAGNESSNSDLFPQYPASYDLENIISVASSNLADQLSVFSNFGAVGVDLAAPGSAIRSTIPGSGYGYLSGTSMAAPHVSGAVALVHSAEPSLDWRGLRRRLLESADRLPALSGKVASGGRLNLRRALGALGAVAAARIEAPDVPLVLLDRGVRSLDLEGGVGVGNAGGTILWTLVEGPAEVEFSSPEALGTRVTFAADGLYRIRFRVESALQVTHDEITVVVGTAAPSTDGLMGFWQFEEAGGATALDSSDQDRNGTLSGVLRETGPTGQAARFDGVGSEVSFESPPTDRITMTAWVRSDSLGEFVFPRVVDTPDYIFYFGRRTGDVDADINSIKFFATKTVQDGIWHTANNTIEDGKWLHVAVSYDGSDPENFPLVFLNGEVLPVGVDARSGDQARGVVGEQTVTPGTAYIGENEAGERAWDGLIDEVRIYSRALSRAEVAWIASESDARFLLESTVESLGRLEVFNPIQIGNFRNSMSAAVTYSWSTTGDSGAIISGPDDQSLVSVIAANGGWQRVRLTTVKGLVAVVRDFDFQLPVGLVPTAGFYRGRFGDGEDEIWAAVDAAGRAIFLGMTLADGHLARGAEVQIGWNGSFAFGVESGRTYRGQFEQDRFSGVSVQGRSVFRGNRVVTGDVAEPYVLAGPVVGSENENVHVLVDPDRNMMLTLSGAGRLESLTGRIAENGAFELTGGSGRTFTGRVDLESLTARGEILDGVERSQFYLALPNGFEGRGLANISSRGGVGIRERVMIAGFVVEGGGAGPVLVRGVGPGLSRFDVEDHAASTGLDLREGTIGIAMNRGWKSGPDVAGVRSVSAGLGAFDLLSDTGDSALLADLGSGVFTVTMTNPSGLGNIALLEVYDALGTDGARMTNLSTRGYTGSGPRTLIAGFVLNGTGPRRILVRVSGPGLAAFGITDGIVDPEVTLHKGGEVLAGNDDWDVGQDGELITLLGNRVGAFAFAPNSADAALTRYLDTGQYTVQVGSADGSTGIALIEIYVVPDPF